MSEIVIYAASLHRLAANGIGFVFTDRHAYLAASEFMTDLAQLERLDWLCLRARDFRRDPNDPEKVERYQAEALIHRHLPIAALSGVICHGGEQEARLQALVREAGLTLPVFARPTYYF